MLARKGCLGFHRVLGGEGEEESWIKKEERARMEGEREKEKNCKPKRSSPEKGIG